ncbi:MAG: glycosyltransferase family 2 protein [Bacteroidota bacterium]|uniref:glycosyltransferase family 2 protein n=1 Tax=Roseivirga sp. UBA838 TaxID=1947393 RepID=UPI00257CBC10|nr:glycosyltransferase family 2 protein [Roseivirga sp. UBA838]MEC7754105.1 glycosyltransferase family 2 protein [Bacteroidota bacterium]|tara:strand:- start:48639 stop:49658 length:1020 start_codon:yes stop_codon:yes gene_type:complete
MEKLSVVLLNYNGRAHLETFLPSVVAHSQPHTVYLVDNGSTDDSLQWVKANFPSVKTIAFSQNHGFCGGYNKALPLIESEYVVLLNTDVEVTKGWIHAPLQLLEQNRTIKALQPKILDYKKKDTFEYAGAAGGYIDWMGYPFCRGRIFETLEKDNGQYNTNTPIFWASGSCLFVHRKTYLKLGGLDEDFFAHMEEIDLCWRIWNAGFQVSVATESIVFHLGGGTLDKSKPKKTYLNFRNGLSLLIKNETIGHLLWKFPLRLALDWVAVFKFSVQSGPQHGLAILHAHLSTFWYMRRTWAKRSKKSQSLPNIPIYRGFITWQYFVKGRKVFANLNRKNLS